MMGPCGLLLPKFKSLMDYILNSYLRIMKQGERRESSCHQFSSININFSPVLHVLFLNLTSHKGFDKCPNYLYFFHLRLDFYLRKVLLVIILMLTDYQAWS